MIDEEEPIKFPCSGSVPVYNYFVYYTDGKYFIFNSDLEQVRFTFSANNAIEKLVTFIIDDDGDFSSAHYAEVLKKVREAVQSIEDD